MVERKRAFLLCVLLSTVSLPALAQDAGSLLREQQLQQELQGLEALPRPEEARPGAPGVAAPEEGATIIVRALRFTGKAELLPEAERERIAASVTGQRLGINGLYALAGKVTARLQQQGRLLARAVLPPQDITEGVVSVEIVEGVVEKIAFERGAGVRAREARLRAVAESRIAPDGVTKKALEAALLRMNDHPGVAAQAKLMPGAAPNTSRLVVGVEQEPVLSASVWGDNFGSTSTGKAQANAAVTLADVTGYGDLTRLTGIVSEGQKYAAVAASMPAGASGFTAQADYSYLTYRNIDDTGRALELEGHAHYLSGGVDYALIRARDLNVRLSAAVNWKALTDESRAGRLQDKRSISGTLGFHGDRSDALLGGGLTTWSLTWTFGDIDLSRVDSALAVDQVGLQTQGNFHRINASAARLQDLPAEFSLFGRLYGQWASKNLDSSEDFALGGAYGVRGWPVGEGRGDMGLLGTLELRYDAPIPAGYGTLQLAGFLDAGHVWINKDPNGISALNACGCNDFSLASAGLSARWARENLSFAVSWAHGLGDNPGRSAIDNSNADGDTDSQQFWLQGALRF